MTKHIVASVRELPVGSRKISSSQPGEYIWARDGEILRCPWHGWEFDLTTGRSIFNPHKLRLKTYEVTAELRRRF